ncbi:MAG: FAD-dependent oxidoreductase, partial [Candidatus Nealsonbacteria bacterium]|nr:FAD-dependent oxidoreductase [Candidatus Nealsonbacteria bacterium]
MYDLIIVGGGPAGMTAGIYAARQKLKILLITEGFGGQMAKKSIDVENYPGFIKISGFDLIKNFENHLKSKKVEIKMAEIKSLKKENG